MKRAVLVVCAIILCCVNAYGVEDPTDFATLEVNTFTGELRITGSADPVELAAYQIDRVGGFNTALWLSLDLQNILDSDGDPTWSDIGSANQLFESVAVDAFTSIGPAGISIGTPYLTEVESPISFLYIEEGEDVVVEGDVTFVPEPAMLGLVGLCVLGLRRR